MYNYAMKGMSMRPYTIDIKLRFHLLSSDIEKDINSIIEMLVTENFERFNNYTLCFYFYGDSFDY